MQLAVNRPRLLALTIGIALLWACHGGSSGTDGGSHPRTDGGQTTQDGGGGDGGLATCPVACVFGEHCAAEGRCQCDPSVGCTAPSQGRRDYALVCGLVDVFTADDECVSAPLSSCPPGEAAMTDPVFGAETCGCTAQPTDSCPAPLHCSAQGLRCGGSNAACDPDAGQGACAPGLVCTSRGCVEPCAIPQHASDCSNPFSSCEAVGDAGYCVGGAPCAGAFLACSYGPDVPSGVCMGYRPPGRTSLVQVCFEPGTAPEGAHCTPFAARDDPPESRCALGLRCFVFSETPDGGVLPSPYAARCVKVCVPGGALGCAADQRCWDGCHDAFCAPGQQGLCVPK